MATKSIRLIRKIVEDIKNKYKPEKIILFGSHAYGNPTKKSDVDLFIIKESKKRRIDRYCEVRKIIRDIKNISIQPVVFTKDEIEERLKIGDDFIREVLERGKVLYAE